MITSVPQATFGLTDDPSALPGLAPQWSAAASAAPYYVPPVTDYLDPDHSGRWRVLTSADGVALLPFRIAEHRHSFTVGERKLGTMRMRALQLVHPFLADATSTETLARALRYTLTAEKIDMIQLGEIPLDSPLRHALDALRWPAQPKRVGRKDGIRWLIDLPESFDAYLALLSSSSRQSIKRKIRKLSKDYDVTLEIFDRPEGLERFLEEGEAISRTTYQWQVGQRLLNDASTLDTYRRLARAGRLRCYLMSLDGTPRAFLRGTLQGGLYHYETPGFDPAFGRTSVGTILLMEALRDLIEQTDARVFDFGIGGDDTGYKATYGTRSIPSASYYVLNLYRAKNLRLLAFESGLNMIKNTANRLLPDGEIRAKIKRWLRKYQFNTGSRP